MRGLHDRGDTEPTSGADGDDAACGAGRVGFTQCLGESGDDAPAGRAEGMSGAQRATVDVEALAVDGAQRRVEAEALGAEYGVLPGLQRAQQLGRERLVDLVEI